MNINWWFSASKLGNRIQGLPLPFHSPSSYLELSYVFASLYSADLVRSTSLPRVHQSIMLPSLMKALCPPGVYLCMVMTMTSLSVIMAVVVTNLYHRGRKMRAAPRWLANLCIHWLARPLCVSNDIPLHAAAVDLVRRRAFLLFFPFYAISDLFHFLLSYCYVFLSVHSFFKISFFIHHIYLYFFSSLL